MDTSARPPHQVRNPRAGPRQPGRRFRGGSDGRGASEPAGRGRRYRAEPPLRPDQGFAGLWRTERADGYPGEEFDSHVRAERESDTGERGRGAAGPAAVHGRVAQGVGYSGHLSSKEEGGAATEGGLRGCSAWIVSRKASTLVIPASGFNSVIPAKALTPVIPAKPGFSGSGQRKRQD